MRTRSRRRSEPAHALAIVLGDQPLLTVEHLTGLRAAWLAGAALVASRFDGIVGAPAVFDRLRWSELATLTGARRPLAAHEDVVVIDWPAGASTSTPRTTCIG